MQKRRSEFLDTGSGWPVSSKTDGGMKQKTLSRQVLFIFLENPISAYFGPFSSVLTQSLWMGLLNNLVTWGPFLERPGPQTFRRRAKFKIKTFWIVVQFLAHKPILLF